MYPYKVYSMDEGIMIYNHDGSYENEIFIDIDKRITNEGVTMHLYDYMYKYYNNDSMGFDETIKSLIHNCMYESKYKHVELIAKFYNAILENERFIVSHF